MGDLDHLYYTEGLRAYSPFQSYNTHFCSFHIIEDMGACQYYVIKFCPILDDNGPNPPNVDVICELRLQCLTLILLLKK